MTILASGEKPDATNRDHELTSEYADTRECHIEPDWLLVYELRQNVLVLVLVRVGSHSDLFK